MWQQASELKLFPNLKPQDEQYSFSKTVDVEPFNKYKALNNVSLDD